jgi:hypothetical protein
VDPFTVLYKPTGRFQVEDGSNEKMAEIMGKITGQASEGKAR